MADKIMKGNLFMLVRLQKYLADAGLCSRRKAEEYILQNKVKINNMLITKLGEKVDTEKDIVYFENREINIDTNKIYIILNKPREYITTVKDQFNRPTVMDLVKDINYRIVPVGRLDYDTSGLLIMTNDGNLVYKITHPKYSINKVYIARVKGIPKEEEIYRFENGLYIDEYKTSHAKFDIIKKYNDFSEVSITIHEGKNRQIRKMCDSIGHEVISLQRIAIGNIFLGDLLVKKYRYLSQKEIDYLYKI